MSQKGQIILMTVTIIFAVWMMLKPTPQTTTSTIKIISVNLNNSVEGGFVLGCGELEEKEYYAFYKILADGGKKFMKIPANKTVIYDTLGDKEAPYIKKEVTGDIVKYKMYLPKGVIKEDYDLSIN